MERGFIVYPTYELTDDGPVVQLYGRLTSGDTFRADVPQTPYFFIEAAQEENAKAITTLDLEETELKTLDGAPVTKVSVRVPKDIPALRRTLEDAGIRCYEADIRFAYRYLIDNALTTGIAIEGEWEKGTYVDRIYRSPDISSDPAWDGDLRTLSIDIETDKRAKTIWSVSLADSSGRTEKLIFDRQCEGAHCFATEKELLKTLGRLVREMDPDIITGWNVVDFDLKVIARKHAEHDLPWSWARGTRECKLRIEKDYFRDSQADIPGRAVLDGIHLLRSSFIKLDSYALESAAQEFLGDGKLFGGKQRFSHIEDAYNSDPDLLLRYNLKDAQLVLDILEKTGALALTVKRSLITGMQLDRVKASIASLDMLYLPRLRASGHVAPSSGYSLKEEQITGGFVMDSKPGIYDYVIVCDFKSLYPSIMRTLNIDPLAFDPHVKQERSDEKYVIAENGAAFSQEQGILPAILEELWAEREEARKEGDELRRYAIKILMNSFFGVLASPNCRFFSMEMANAITKTGQHLIKRSAELIREKGYEVIYSDTDSVFIDLAVKTEEEARRIGEEVQRSANSFLQEYAKERYRRESSLELEFEKIYVRFLMPKTRGGEGSKKRYAGLLRKDGKDVIDITGLEFVRRDWTEAARDFQYALLELIFAGKDPKAFIRSYVEDVRSGKHDGKLVYRKALRKGVDEYTKTTPPHVKAARLMEDMTSPIVEYVMTVDGPEPLENVRHSIDYEHYIDKQIEPIADSILGFYGTTLSDVLAGTKQKGLFEF